MNIAIVDDDKNEIDKIKKYLFDYSKEKNISFEISTFNDGFEFLEAYSPIYRIIFMDIDMPKCNGMQTAEKIRRIDKSVCIVFVTNYIQYAVDGYAVSASDYLVKPLDYKVFKNHFEKIIHSLSKHQNGNVNITSGNEIIRMPTSEILFIEVFDHYLIYHTLSGEYKSWNSLKSIEKELKDYHFERCNNCYLVNLAHVRKLDGNDCIVGNNVLTISRSKKKSFTEALLRYM